MKKIIYMITILVLMISITGVSYNVDAVTKPKQVTSLSVTNKTEQGKGIIKVAYKKVKGAKGYLIKYSTNSKYKNAKYKRIKNVTTLAATIKNLKSDKKYYVKVRAYKTSGGKYIYGKYSKTKTAYTYKTPQKVTSLKLSNKTTESTGKVKVTYKKTSYASGYQIKYSTSSKFKNSKNVYIKGKSTTSKTISGLKTNKTYYIKVRAYRTKNSKKYYGPYSKVLKVATDAPKSLVKTFVLDDYRNKPYTNDSYVLKELKTNLDKGRPNTTITDIHQDTVTMYNLNFNPYELGVDTHEKLETIRAWYYLMQDIAEKYNLNNNDRDEIDVNLKIIINKNDYNLIYTRLKNNTIAGKIFPHGIAYGYYTPQTSEYCVSSIFYRTNYDTDKYVYESSKEMFKKANITTADSISVAFTKILEQIALHCEYDRSYSHNDIASMFKYGIGVCDSYAQIMEYMTKLIGIDVGYQSGITSAPHAWNSIKINNVDYYFDVTAYTLDMPIAEIKQFYEDNPNYIITGNPEWWYFELENIIYTKSQFEEKGYIFH